MTSRLMLASTDHDCWYSQAHSHEATCTDPVHKICVAEYGCRKQNYMTTTATTTTTTMMMIMMMMMMVVVVVVSQVKKLFTNQGGYQLGSSESDISQNIEDMYLFFHFEHVQQVTGGT